MWYKVLMLQNYSSWMIQCVLVQNYICTCMGYMLKQNVFKTKLQLKTTSKYLLKIVSPSNWNLNMNPWKQFVVSHTARACAYTHKLFKNWIFFQTHISTQNFRFLQWVALVELTLSNSHTCHLVLLRIWNHK